MLKDEISSLDIRSESENLVLPAGDHEFPLAGCFPHLRVDVHCKESAGAVEDRGERAHQRRQHHRQHQTSQT